MNSKCPLPLFLTMFTVCVLVLSLSAHAQDDDAGTDRRPNIVFAIADDWGWPHASALGDRAVNTPNFDRVANEGVLFTHTFISSPSCTPSRGAIITGQHFWRLKSAANLWSRWPHNTFAEYPQMLKESGYHIGHYRKAWGPGKAKRQPAGARYRSVDAFFDDRPDDQPFCFWFGSFDPHRGYRRGSGKAAGIELDKVHLFPFFPDNETVRNDVADYYFEVQRFDRQVGQLLEKLEAMGELENTIIVVTGDHGMPFPRCKANVYDAGARVPFAIMGPGIKPGRTVHDLISLTDVAPTFLEAADLDVPREMTGQSLWPTLSSTEEGWVDREREAVFVGRERHVVAQEEPERGGYPVRAIRTRDYLYIKNFEPDRWPAGTPNYQKAEFDRAWLADCDNGPTKMELWRGRDEPSLRRQYKLCFGKRPSEELYVLADDPHQMNNVADMDEYQAIKARLAQRLMKELKATDDPRAFGRGEVFDNYPYFGGAPRFPAE